GMPPPEPASRVAAGARGPFGMTARVETWRCHVSATNSTIARAGEWHATGGSGKPGGGGGAAVARMADTRGDVVI
ncbi:MAG: hypothetical protein M1482_15910, partial [Chloroflexi bacterium]|nr:hypothetical protein [Chloroflexota bacterium]